MHRWRLWTALPVFAAFAASAAVIYKWTDADGVVHFSDQSVPGAEKIVTSSGSNNGIGGASRSAGPASNSTAAAAPGHSAVAIESPASEQVFFGDDIVPVRLHLEPALQPNQSVAWQLNGRVLTDQAPDAISFSLQALSRGTYTLAATVTNAATGQTQSSEVVTFYVRQPSALAPQHKKS